MNHGGKCSKGLEKAKSIFSKEDYCGKLRGEVRIVDNIPKGTAFVIRLRAKIARTT